MRGPRVAALGLLTAVVLALGAAPAAAHAVLLATTPVAGEQVDAAPAAVVLHFAEPVGVNRRSLEVLDAHAGRVDLGGVVHPDGDDTRVRVRLRAGLPKGAYLVLWRVVSADGHPIAGSFSFGVGVPADTASAGPDLSVDPVLALLDALARWAALAGTTVLVGGAIFVVVVWRQGWASRRVRRIIGLAWLTTTVATAALLVLQGPYGASLGPGDVADPSLLSVTVGTLYGRLLVLRLLALAGAVAVWWPIRSGRTPPGRFDVAGLTLLVVETFSFAGHPGQGGLVPVTTTVDALHLLAAAVWIGGLVVLVTAWAPAAARDWDLGGPRALRRWSRTATVAVAVIVVTGALQAWRQVGDWPALWSTTYGLLLLAKIVLLLAVLAFAAVSRRRAGIASASVAPSEDEIGPAPVGGGTTVLLTQTPAAPAPTLRRLRLSAGAEAVLLAVVLALTAVLVDTVPAVQAYAPSFTTTVPGSGADGATVRVRLTVSPTRAGSQTLDVDARGPDGRAIDLTGLDGSVQADALGLGPITFTGRPAGGGHVRATGVAVPAPGVWTMVLQLRAGPGTDYEATATYTVG